MEVTNSNFKENYESIRQAILEADFLALDGEFTGLGTGSHNIHALDTPEERYQKLRQGGVDFLLIQFGLCAFKYDEDQNKYTNKAYNFYLFPRPFSRQATDQRFLCQSSSIDFLIAQGFDFNKVFKEGIPYLLPTEEQRLRESLRQKHNQQVMQFSSPAFTSPMGDPLVAKSPAIVPDEHKKFIEDVCTKIEEFQKSSEETLNLDPCNGYLRKLIYQTVSIRFKSGVHLETKTGEKKERFIVVSKAEDDAALRRREDQKRAAEVQELDDAVGFSKVIRSISESGKLVLGHNMVLDVLHVIHKFSSPLPEDYEEFKALARCVFPRLIDTKLMASTQPFKDRISNTTLGDLLQVLERPPFHMPTVESVEGFPAYSTKSEQLHEAGYDAYITGLCFIAMLQFLGNYQSEERRHVPVTSELLIPFLNKLFLMRVHDIPYLNLAGPDLTPSRDHVFHVTFPKEWKTSDLSQLFSAFGHVFVAWIDDTSAFVGLYKKDQSDVVLKTLTQGETYKLITYEEYIRSTQPKSKSRKRPLPVSDVDLPTSRKRSRSSE